MTSNCTWKFGPLAICGMLACGLAQAQSPAQALLDDSFVASLGTFIVNSSLKANFNGSVATNPEVNFDDTFGKSRDATRWRFDGLWRITPAHHLRLMYFDNANSRTRTLADDLKWGDYTFNKGSSTTSESGAVSSNSVAAPLPLIGLRGGWVVAPQWYVDAGASVFKIKYDAYDGQWTDWRAAATWMYNRNFGLGLGVNGFTSNVKVTKDNFDGRLKNGYSGLQLFVTGAY